MTESAAVQSRFRELAGLATRKRDSGQPQDAERKRDSPPPQGAERKRDSAQPQGNGETS
jgi:hypothetical protein